MGLLCFSQSSPFVFAEEDRAGSDMYFLYPPCSAHGAQLLCIQKHGRAGKNYLADRNPFRHILLCINLAVDRSWIDHHDAIHGLRRGRIFCSSAAQEKAD